MNKKHLKNVGPIRHCEPPHAVTPIHQMSLAVLSRAACASMSTKTTTTTTRDRGDRYGPMEWAQWKDLMRISRDEKGPKAIYIYPLKHAYTQGAPIKE